MDIQKVVEEAGKTDVSLISSMFKSAGHYFEMARDAFHKLLGYRPGEGKAVDLAVLAFVVTAPILVIKPLIRFAVKFVALTAGSALLLNMFYPMPSEQLIVASLFLGTGFYALVKAIKK
ncbi:MAG: hypothetical protein GF307_10670 [candidate division Zixibacteria bacterium]|nr:hypothetical protein [candidate division Zixibacteria bacterium]